MIPNSKRLGNTALTFDSKLTFPVTVDTGKPGIQLSKSFIVITQLSKNQVMNCTNLDHLELTIKCCLLGCHKANRHFT